MFIRLGETLAGVNGVAALVAALLGAYRHLHTAPQEHFDLLTPFVALVTPQGVGDWMELVGVLLFGALMALTTAAAAAAKARNQRR